MPGVVMPRDSVSQVHTAGGSLAGNELSLIWSTVEEPPGRGDWFSSMDKELTLSSCLFGGCSPRPAPQSRWRQNPRLEPEKAQIGDQRRQALPIKG
jgi:hypothetical protein